MRARNPRVGWSAPYTILMPGVATAVTLVFLVTLIFGIVLPSFTLDQRALESTQNLQIASLAWMLIAAILPMISIGAMLSTRHPGELDKFGSGSFRAKVAILLASSLLLTASAGWRLGAASSFQPSLGSKIPWYLSRAAYYIVEQALNLIIVLCFAALRVDRRFWVPNGACHEGTYSVEVLHNRPEDDDEKAITLRPYEQGIVQSDRHANSLRDGRRLTHFERQILATKPARALPGSRLSVSQSTVLEYDEETGRFGLRPI